MRRIGKWFSRDELRRFVRFSLTGVINTGVDFAVFFTLAQLIGVSVYVSQFISYSTATVNSYLINRRWTFRGRRLFVGREFVRFVAVNVCSLGISLLCMRLFHGSLHMQKMAAKAITACFTIPINFLGSRFWAFNVRDSSE